MKQYTNRLLGSDSGARLLLGVTILCLVFAGAYAFRHKTFLSLQAQFDPNSLIQIEPNEAALKAYVAEDQNLMETMKGDNLFAKDPPKTNPVKEVDIIGQEVLVNGKLYKVGDKVGDAEIMAITAQSVTVQWNGATSTFSPINGQDQGGGSRGSRPRSGRPSPGPTVSRNRPKRSESRPMPARPPRAGMRMPTPEQMEQFRKMSPEQRQAATKEWMRNSR
ncbi:MAG: hypothetical protein GY809_24040 [Planctomycetes bacterium]|nr:hypothetical protein [Planctomycetota bacterium]